MAIILSDTFTEGTDTALGSHTLDTRPGSEVWTVSAGTLTVIAASDDLQISGTGNHRGGVDYGMSGVFAVQATLKNLSGAGGTFAYPGIQAYLSTAYDKGQGMAFTYQVNEQRYRLVYNSTTDGNGGVNFSSGTPGSPVVLRMVRQGNTLYGYVDGVLRCTLDLSGTVDFSGNPTLYPGLNSETYTGSCLPYWDNFQVEEPDGTSGVRNFLNSIEHGHLGGLGLNGGLVL